MSTGVYCLLMGDRRASKWDSPPEATPEEVAKSHGRVKQCIGTLIVSLTSLNCGLSMKWVSSTPLALVAGACPVDEVAGSVFTDSVSSSQYASFIAALLMGLTANYYGRKNALFLSCVVNLIGGGILRSPTLGSSNLWVGRVCVSCNIITALTITPMFVSEIAQKRIRGTLMLSSIFLIHIGVICAFALRGAIAHKMYSNIYIAIPFIQLLFLTFIPETPYFLVSKHRTLEAEGSLFWYRGSNRSIAKGELSILIKASPKIHTSLWGMITSHQGTKNALIISVGLVFFKRLSGFVIFCCFSGLIMRKAGDPLNSENSTLLLAGLQSISGVLGVILIDLVGRKVLLYVSQIGNVIFLSVFSIYLMFKSINSVTGESWLPFICLCGFIFTFSVGVLSMTSVISNEVTPIRVKGIIAALDGILTSLLVLVAVQCYPYLAEHVGDYLNFVIPAVINVIGLIFTWVVIPEAKGKALHEILMKMNGQKSDSELMKMEVTHL